LLQRETGEHMRGWKEGQEFALRNGLFVSSRVGASQHKSTLPPKRALASAGYEPSPAATQRPKAPRRKTCLTNIVNIKLAPLCIVRYDIRSASPRAAVEVSSPPAVTQDQVTSTRLNDQYDPKAGVQFDTVLAAE
jgi:hypothetical protein